MPECAPPRLPGLDRLRAAALLLMLVHHLTDWLSSDARWVIPGWEGFVVTDVAAPAFAVAAGASAWLLLSARRDAGASTRELATTMVRRYGLLIPIGVGLRAALGWNLDGFGVLEALGAAVLVAAGLAMVMPARWLAPVAVGALAAAPLVERAAEGAGGWLANEVLAGKFPLALYTAFALAGTAAARALRTDRSDGAIGALAIGAVLTGVTLVAVVAGAVPDRYPGGWLFVVPGLAGTALLYGLVARSTRADGLLIPAGRHTLGLFVGHYGVFALLRATGHLGDVDPWMALVVAAIVTTLAVAVAPHVPQPPWTLRRGRRTQPTPADRQVLVTSS